MGRGGGYVGHMQIQYNAWILQLNIQIHLKSAWNWDNVIQSDFASQKTGIMYLLKTVYQLFIIWYD